MASLKIDTKSSPIDFVTVFNDRAEIVRTLKGSVSAGTTEILFGPLPTSVDANSVRVSGGAGKVTILEAGGTIQTPVVKGEDNKSRIGELQGKVTGLKDQRREVDEDLARVAKEAAWVEQWASKFMQSPSTNATNPATAAFLQMTSDDALGQLDNFLDYYAKKLLSIDERNVKLNEKKQALEQQIRALETEIPKLSRVDYTTQTRVLLEAQADNTEFTLQLSYVVLGASWVAAYDVRANSESASLKDTKLVLTYYGSISNNTGEDWTEVELSLSTARPSIGGAPPPLTTTYVNFYNPYQPQGHSRSPATTSNMMVFQAEMGKAEMAFEDEDQGGGGTAAAPAVLTASAKESSTCTTFAIPRRSTVLADNKAHKVTVTIVNLDAVFTHTTIPQLAPHAYLKAHVRNSSKDFPFLAGEMLVFMDNNFVAKSEMKATQPGESFALYLGTDGGIKVEASHPSHVKDTTGYFSKANVKTVTHKTSIRNTKATPISIAMFEQLPKSNDGSLKVKLLNPTIDQNTDGEILKITEANNVRWKFTIEAGKKLDVVFQYSIEWPLGRALIE